MLSMMFIVIGVIAAILLLSLIPKVPARATKVALTVVAVFAVFAGIFLSSFRFIPEDKLGVVVRNIGPKLEAGKIIATSGEAGPQARILPPGWHSGYWPFIYDIEIHPLVEVSEGSVAILTAKDGKPLPEGMTYAPDWDEGDRQRMASDAQYFLTEGNGYKGPQATVLTPGRHRINPKLYEHSIVAATNVEKATVGVVKSNAGTVDVVPDENGLVPRGSQGIWESPLSPKLYFFNPKAFEVTMISTERRTVRYTAAEGQNEEREISVKTSDGYTFPVDVRIEYQILPTDAPRVVAAFGDDGAVLQERLNSAVRAIFRNNAETVKALDYVQQRSRQESQSLQMLAEEMRLVGVTITAVRIGDVGGDDENLAELLKTQTDREIAKQEQETLKQQQLAAEQRKELMRIEQEAEEEQRLATATYDVQIAEQEKQRRLLEAQAEAEATEIRAEAQARAFQMIADEIGSTNAALIEILKTVGEHAIEITPRVMVSGGES
ncbi:MAG: hypothetical protein KDA28_12020, partial [Phycisphaerales bacterium]|nr:hypothetical protein [Phycisphaerales bacterium]